MLTQVRTATAGDDAFPRHAVERLVAGLGVPPDALPVEAFRSLIDEAEQRLGCQYVRMDFGAPALPAPDLAVAAQLKALTDHSAAALYPPHEGLPRLREAAAAFISTTLAISAGADDCFVTCGATQALFIAQAIAARCRPGRSHVLFLEPGYPPGRAQAAFLGIPQLRLDVLACRGEDFRRELHSLFSKHPIGAVVWSAPNNPAWFHLGESELREIAALCRASGAIPVEDLTYMGMDPPATPAAALQPSIAHYTDRYVLVLSASKVLSYPGERIGIMLAAPGFLAENCPALDGFYGTSSVRRALSNLIFNLTAGAPFSPQYGIAAVLEAVVAGSYDLTDTLAPYRQRSAAAKQLLRRCGFEIVEREGSAERRRDGFYFLFRHPHYRAQALAHELLLSGVAALPASLFGADEQAGLRACVSKLDEQAMSRLERRLEGFVNAAVKRPNSEERP